MRRELDRPLLLIIIFLLGLGIVQVYSSSFIFAIESFDDGLFFVKKQALFAVIGGFVFIAAAMIPLKWLEKIGVAVWILAFIGVLLTLVPGLGVKVGGATRWLNIGAGFRVEPSEILKYSYPILLAFFLDRSRRGVDGPYVRGIFYLIIFLPLIVLLKQPDFGSVAIICAVLFSIFFSQGLQWRYVMAASAILTTTLYFLIVRVDYRMARVQAFIDPWSDPAQKGFQIIQSMLGYFSGGLTGVGLGQGQGKLFFLPEAHTDFTLSVLGEEMGFIGVFFVLLFFGYIIFRGMQISAQSQELKRQIMSLGITVLFAVTVLINAGVTLGILPTKGLGMPFLSYGGSALLASCFGLGVLLNIERQNRIDLTRSFIKLRE